jgi:hypothetical protein
MIQECIRNTTLFDTDEIPVHLPTVGLFFFLRKACLSEDLPTVGRQDTPSIFFPT